MCHPIHPKDLRRLMVLKEIRFRRGYKALIRVNTAVRAAGVCNARSEKPVTSRITIGVEKEEIQQLLFRGRMRACLFLKERAWPGEAVVSRFTARRRLSSHLAQNGKTCLKSKV